MMNMWQWRNLPPNDAAAALGTVIPSSDLLEKHGMLTDPSSTIC